MSQKDSDFMSEREWSDWLATRPKSVQELAAEFPYGTSGPTCDGPVYVIGWTENDQLIVSRINPYDNLDGSRKNTMIVPACFARQNSGRIMQ